MSHREPPELWGPLHVITGPGSITIPCAVDIDRDAVRTLNDRVRRRSNGSVYRHQHHPPKGRLMTEEELLGQFAECQRRVSGYLSFTLTQAKKGSWENAQLWADSALSEVGKCIRTLQRLEDKECQ